MQRIVALIVVLLVSLGLFMGCGGDDSGDGTASNGGNAGGDAVGDSALSTADVDFVKDGESVYRLVRPDGDKVATAISQYLYKQLKDRLSVNVRNVADTEDGTDQYEILIGMTNREESKTAAAYLEGKTGGRYDDYVICTIGKKICIHSNNPEVLKTAAEYFINTYVKAEGVKGGIAYIKVAEGDFETVTVNGVNIGKFNLVRPHYNSSWLTEVEMEKIVETVYQKTGYMMAINHDSYIQPQQYEIIVGDTSREGVEKITNYDEFKITVMGDKVYLNGGSAHATAMAVSEFAKLLKGDIKDSVSYIGSYETAMASYDKKTTFYKTWGDDFDGVALDTNKWRQQTESNRTQGQNGKTSVRSSDPHDVFVADGKFYICAREDDNYYYGGMIRTQGVMNYKYGYAEISSVIPHGDSFWIAWWACSDDSESTIYPDMSKVMSPEIDIVECFGNSKYYQANCHSWPTEIGKLEFGYKHTSLDGDTYGKDKRYSCPDEGVNLGDGFHTYGFLWTPEEMAFTCDGDLFFTYATNTNEADLETFNHSMYFIYSMALAFADAPGNPITTNPEDWQNTNKLILDWLNLYQKDDGVHELDWRYAN